MAKRKPDNNETENVSIGVLKILLNTYGLKERLTQGYDNFPGIDGYIHLPDSGGQSTGQIIQVQVKTLIRRKSGKVCSQFHPSLLDYSLKSTTPVLLIGVDNEAQEAYWLYLSPEYVNYYLENKKPLPKETVTFNFDHKNLLTKTTTDFPKKLKDISRHHLNRQNDTLLAEEYRKQLTSRALPSQLLERVKTLQALFSYRTHSGERPLIEPALSLLGRVREHPQLTRLNRESVELLKSMMYFEMAESFNHLVYFSKHSDSQVAKDAFEQIKNLTNYNLFVLQSSGYPPYNQILEEVSSWPKKEMLENLEVVLQVLENIVSVNVEATSWDKMTMTMHRASVTAVPYYKKMRVKAIGILSQMLGWQLPTDQKIKILHILGGIFYGPETGLPNGKAGEDFEKMIKQHTKIVTDIFEDISLTKTRKVKGDLPIIYEIESKISLLRRNGKATKKVIALQEKLRTDNGAYGVFRLMFGHSFDLEHHNDMRVEDDVVNTAIDNLYQTIDTTTIEQWYEKLTAIATFRDIDDRWKFNPLRSFLTRIATEKPDIAHIFLKKALEDNGPLLYFSGAILNGLVISDPNKWLWTVKKLVGLKDLEVLISILTSLENAPDKEKALSTYNRKLIEDVAKSKGRFAYLDKPEPNIGVRFQLFRVLLHFSEADPSWAREMIIEQIQKYPNYIDSYLSQIAHEVHFNRFSLRKWNKKQLKVIVDALATKQHIDHHDMEAIQHIANIDYDLAMGIFYSRFHSKDLWLNASPRHIEEGFRKFVTEHKRYLPTITKWVSEMKHDHSRYDLALNSFLTEFRGEAYEKLIAKIIKGGKKKDLELAIELMPNYQPPDVDVCMKIISKTDDKEVWSSVMGLLFNLGGLSGTYGDNLRGDALRRKLNDVQSAVGRNENKRTKEFLKLFTKTVKRQIKQEDEEHEKRMKDDEED